MKKLFKVDLNVKTMVQLAMFMAITIILGYVNKIIPEMPQGGAFISIDVIAIFFMCLFTRGWLWRYLWNWRCYFAICFSNCKLLGSMVSFVRLCLTKTVCGIAPLIKSTHFKEVPIY